MPKRSFKGDKRRRELAKKKKQEEKRLRRQDRDGEPEGGEDTSYLEYLNPGGPVDGRYTEDEESDEEASDEGDNSEDDFR